MDVVPSSDIGGVALTLDNTLLVLQQHEIYRPQSVFIIYIILTPNTTFSNQIKVLQQHEIYRPQSVFIKPTTHML